MRTIDVVICKFGFVGVIIVKLKDCCILLTDGDWIESKDQSASGIRLIQTGNVGNGEYLEKENRAKYISEETFKKIGCTEIFPGDILVSRLPDPVGRACLIPEKDERMITAVDCSILRVDESKLNKRYLLHFLKSSGYYSQLSGKLAGTTRIRVSRKNLEQVVIEVPDRESQELVVAVIDKLETVIQMQKAILRHLDELTKARFVEMFGNIGVGDYKYETCKLGDVSNVGSSHRVFTTEFVDKGIPFYRGTEIGELANGQQPTVLYYISEEHYKRLANDDTKPQIGDLLMPSICNKGQVWMVDTEVPFYYKDGRVLSISPDRNVFNSKFLQYFMREKTLVEYPKMGSGSTFAEFKIFLLKDIDVLIPPREIQERFAAFVLQVDKSKVVVQKALDEAQVLFDSLMQKYFG